MRRFFSIISILALFACLSNCDKDDGGNDEPKPGTVKVTAQYTGTLKTGVVNVDDGTGKIFVYLVDSLGTTAPASSVYSGSTDGAVEQNTDYTITISNVPAGDYYVLVFYDFKLHDKREAGKNDRYVLYNNTTLVSGAVITTVADDTPTTITAISFGDQKLGESAAYLTSK